MIARRVAVFMLALLGTMPYAPHAARAQFTSPSSVGTVGGACSGSTYTYGWPDANGNILKCVSNIWTLQGVAATAAGSTGQVQFNNAGALGASSNFYWDNTNGRVGIGTTAPLTALDLHGGFNITPSSGGGSAVILPGVNSTANGAYWSWGVENSASSDFLLLGQSGSCIYNRRGAGLDRE